MRFTSGPWGEHGKGGCSCGLIFGPDGNSTIATVYGPMHLSMSSEGPDCVPDTEHQKANVRLIAAAPDLYECLKAILEWQEEDPTGLGALQANNRARQILAKIDATIS